jgi:hypothetical protein
MQRVEIVGLKQIWLFVRLRQTAQSSPNNQLKRNQLNGFVPLKAKRYWAKPSPTFSWGNCRRPLLASPIKIPNGGYKPL